MTPEAQCILIAEACGYSVQECLDGLIEWRNPDGGYLGRYLRGICPSVVPKYTTDLNGMHQAENALPQDLRARWMIELCKITEDSFWSTARATAAQRAEAFLRALNLWRDDV